MTLAAITIPEWLPWLLMGGGGVVVVLVVGWIALTKRGEGPSPHERLAEAKQRATAPRSSPAPSPITPPRSDIQASQAEHIRELRAISEDLIREIDQRAERLERLLAQADRRIADLERAGSRGDSGPPAAPSAEPMRESDPSADQILALSRQGLTPVQIAQRTGQGVGAVQLVLALRK
jgi:hypothetical protein